MTVRVRSLMADDHQIVRTSLQDILGSQPDVEMVAEATTGAEVVEPADRLHPKVS